MIGNKSNFLSSLYQKILLATLLGALQVFAFAPFSQWWILYPSFVGLFLLLKTLHKTNKHFFIVIFAFNLAMFLATIYWVYFSMALYGGMPVPVSILLLVILCAYLAIFPTIALWASTRLVNVSDKIRYLLAIPVFWLVMDWFRGYFLTGFPWAYLGYSHVDTPLVGFAPVVGVEGITLSIMIICGALTLMIQKQHINLSLTVIISLIIGGYALTKLNYTNLQPAINVALVQGNIPQKDKWLPNNLYPSLRHYLTLSDKTSAKNTLDLTQNELVIWPESAIAALEIDVQPFMQQLNWDFKKEHKTLITGIIEYDIKTNKYYNTIVALGYLPKGHGYSLHSSNRYNKHHLLPIGEFVPFSDLLRPLAPYFNLPMSSFTPGNIIQANLKTKQVQIAPAICYEIAFPNLLRQNVHKKTGILLNISNDAWFDASIDASQHLQIARMRSIELARPLLRSTNTGISAIFDNKGVEIGRLASNVTGVLRTQVRPAFGTTPYQRMGYIPLYVYALISLFLLLVLNRKTNK